ncbi:MAG: hypothetical protein GF334_12775 [Candidatus Altiarchaeales archaeon]|nr:hypothetical protein [Candidatus Altiarchaeales archaeon]
MKPRIIITDKLHERAVSLAEEFAEVDEKLNLTPQKLSEEIAGYDAIIIRSGTKLTKEIIEKSSLKAIGRAGVGLDNVDLKACAEKNIKVFNSPESSTISVAEHSIGLMLSFIRNTCKGHASLKEGRWDRKKYLGNEVYGKTLGVIGFGRIGREVALRAKSFGMNVCVYDPHITSEDAREFGCTHSGLTKLLNSADIVTLHVPATDETKNLINKETLSQMKKDAFLVNTSRGAVVDEDALYQTLKDGNIKGAALDVFQNEPPKDSPLLGLENVVLTPHLAASTQEAQINAGTVVVEKIRNHLMN